MATRADRVATAGNVATMALRISRASFPHFLNICIQTEFLLAAVEFGPGHVKAVKDHTRFKGGRNRGRASNHECISIGLRSMRDHPQSLQHQPKYKATRDTLDLQTIEHLAKSLSTCRSAHNTLQRSWHTVLYQ